MRIIIDIDSARDANGKKATRVRTKWYSSAKDAAWVRNAGVEIYEGLKEIFDTAYVGGIMIHQGEVK